MNSVEPDRPITAKAQDVLNRAPFAENLARAILNYSSTESLVIGLYGEWGSGKTSIINMMVERLTDVKRDKKLPAPIIVRFNPWNFSDHNDLIAQFFAQLSVDLEGKGAGTKMRAIAPLVARYAAGLGTLALLPLGPAGPLLAALGMIVQKTAEAVAEEPRKDLAALKNDIEKSLLKQKQRIVVLIDDIDRLTGEEVRQVFKLVKAVADFPNTVYILSMERDVVAGALDHFHPGKGGKYLEKIIQIPIDVPMPSRTSLDELMLSRISTLVDEYSIREAANGDWRTTYMNGVSGFISNVRDANHLTNMLRFALSAIGDDVNIGDLVAITALQLFAPNVYYGVSRHRECLAGPALESIQELKIDELRLLVVEITGTLGPRQLDYVKSLLSEVFPKVRAAFSNYRDGTDAEFRGRADARAYSVEYFDYYFQLTLEPGGVSRSEVHEFIDRLFDLPAACGYLRSLNHAGRLASFVNRFPDLVDEVSPTFAYNAVQALILESDSMSDVNRSLDWVFKRPAVAGALWALLSRCDTSDQLAKLIDLALNNAQSALFATLYIVKLAESDVKRNGAGNSIPSDPRATLTEAELSLAVHRAVAELRHWAQLPDALSNPNTAWLLNVWRMWGDATEVRSFVTRAIKSDQGLTQVLEAFDIERQQGIVCVNWLDSSSLANLLDHDTARLRLEPLTGVMSSSSLELKTVRLAERLLKFLNSQASPAVNA